MVLTRKSKLADAYHDVLIGDYNAKYRETLPQTPELQKEILEWKTEKHAAANTAKIIGEKYPRAKKLAALDRAAREYQRISENMYAFVSDPINLVEHADMWETLNHIYATRDMQPPTEEELSWQYDRVTALRNKIAIRMVEEGTTKS